MTNVCELIPAVHVLHVCCRPRKMMPTDPIQAMEFAQSKGQARKEGKTGITFGDIAGMEATKQELQEVVEVGSAVP